MKSSELSHSWPLPSSNVVGWIPPLGQIPLVVEALLMVQYGLQHFLLEAWPFCMDTKLLPLLSQAVNDRMWRFMDELWVKLLVLRKC
jgi:hypothetical protein